MRAGYRRRCIAGRTGLRVVHVTHERVLHELSAVLELFVRTARHVTPARFPAREHGYGALRQRQEQAQENCSALS